MAAETVNISDITPAETVPISEITPGHSPSVMDPHPVQNAVQNFGETISQYDPTTKEGLKKDIPIVAGTAMALAPEGAPVEGLAAKTALRFLGGAAAPYAEAGAAKVTGQDVAMPSAMEALRSGAFNAGLGIMHAPLGETPEKGLKDAAGGLSPENVTPTQLRQLSKNRDFLAQMGMKPEDIDAIAKRADVGDVLASYVKRGQETKKAYGTLLDETRKDFTNRYDAAYGPLKEAPVDINPVQSALSDWGAKGAQHELTPSFRSFLQRKAGELAPPEPAGITDPLSIGGKPLDPSRPGDAKLIASMKEQGLLTETPAQKPFTVQNLRDLRSEIRENVPSNATPLDMKAAKDLNDKVTQQYEGTLRANGASNEQIGRLQEIDQDYGRFAETNKALDPRSEKFGDQVASALWDTAKNSPSYAMNLVDLAQKAEAARPGEVMPQLRQSFLDNMVQKAGAGRAGPVEQMKAMRTLQDQWGGTAQGQAVLDKMWGKGSPMADPQTASQVLGQLDSPEAKGKLMRALDGAGSGGYMIRALALGTLAGGSAYGIAQHPDRAPAILGTLLTLGVAGPLLSRMTPPAQRAYVNFILSPTAAAARNLGRVAGPTIVGLESQPHQ